MKCSNKKSKAVYACSFGALLNNLAPAPAMPQKKKKQQQWTDFNVLKHSNALGL